MDKLLNWSLAQNDPATAAKVGAPDPELLSKLFAKADDPTLMKESIAIVKSTDPEVTRDDKIIAFENFEMLIENLDNANNIENLKLWDAVIEELENEDVEFRILACSIIGTSVQNVEKAQADFLAHPAGFKSLIKLALNDDKVRLKALYALSNLIRNNKPSYEIFDELKGWELLGPILSNEKLEDRVKLRSLSLLSAILSLNDAKDDIFTHIKEYSILNKILSAITEKSSISLVDKALNLLTHLINLGYKFDDEELRLVKGLGDSIEAHFKDVINVDDYQLLKQVL